MYLSFFMYDKRFDIDKEASDMDDGNILEFLDEIWTYILMIFCDMCFTILDS